VDRTLSTIDPVIAARLAELEALVDAQRAALDDQRAALDAERARRADIEAERDRLKEAYDALVREVELARRRLFVAKAERIDTTQLELEFAAKLAALDAFAGRVDDDDDDDDDGDDASASPEGNQDKAKRKRGRRDLRLFDLPEERVEIPDPLLDGKAARIGTEEHSELKWKRGGLVRVVFVRFKYDTSTPVTIATSTPAPATEVDTTVVSDTTRASDSGAQEIAPVSEVSAPEEAPPAWSVDELRALVASDPRTAGAAIVTAPMPPRLIERSYATPSLLGHVASDKFCARRMRS